MSKALAIPTLLMGGPVGAGLVFWWIGGKFGHPTSGFLLGAALGLAAAIRETVKILREMARADAAQSSEKPPEKRNDSP